MAQCEQCSLFACSSCLGVKSNVDMEDKIQKELVAHFTETAAPELKKCTNCKNSIRKTYKSRVKKQVDPENEWVELFSGKLK